MHIQRLGNTVEEGRRKVVVFHAVRLVDPLSFSRSGERVGTQGRADTLNNIGDVYAERKRAAVDKGRVARDLAQFTDTQRHLFDFEVQSRNLFHCRHPLTLKKITHSSQSNFFETSVKNTRGTTQITTVPRCPFRI